MNALSHIAPPGSNLSAGQVREFIAKACPPEDYRGRKVLLIVPDGTRTCPLDLMFRGVFDQIGAAAAALDVMIALGTHQPMSEEAICERLGITAGERSSTYRSVRFFNHAWDDRSALRKVGVITKDESSELSNGLLAEEVPVEVNAKVFDYDELMIVGPVFPHEVVGFSGGNKYIFPGVSGPTVLNYFHWLGALVTNPMIIGNKWTPVRKVVDRAASLVTVPKRCFCMVVTPGDPAHGGGGLAAVSFGDPVGAWDAASDVSKRVHITYKERPFQTVLSCAPKMYDEMWVGGKCMYKLEPVVADGGELIIYAPHIHELSVTHGRYIREIGYHCRDYFTAQPDRFAHIPKGVIAHSTHVRGIGTYENGVEKCRVLVTFATGIPEDVCKAINVGYRDPRGINPSDYADREGEGVLLVPKAGEMLFHLRKRPAWAREM
jgi:nickel-dependent lactate racemase